MTIICFKEDCIFNEHEKNDSPTEFPVCIKDVITITDELICDEFEGKTDKVEIEKKCRERCK